jgi:uncharacterized protein (TIGR03066 family)
MISLALLSGCSGKKESDKKDADKDGSSKDASSKDGKEDKAKDTTAKLVGTWELTKSEGGGTPGSTIEFDKNNNVKMTAKLGGASTTAEGKFFVEGDLIKTAITTKSGKEVADQMKIKSLTGTNLTVEDRNGKTDEYKKK